MKTITTLGFLFLSGLTLVFSQICTSTDIVGSASNMYSIGLGESSAIAVNNDLNTVLFIHRNNDGLFGGHSGQLRYDISTNDGVSWTSNLGILNPLSVNGTNAARYPNVAIHNPVGNTIPNNAYLTYLAPTVAATWASHVSGVRKLDGTGNTENYNQASITNTLIPRSVCKGAPGIYWGIDLVNNGTTNLGYRILKGVWNSTVNDVIWSQNAQLTPPFNTAYDGTNHVSSFAIGFDPTGQKGWACMITHITQGTSSFSYYPVFYSTTNGGATWSSPTQVNIAQFPCVSSIITTGNVATVAFDMDLTVDMYGNPHAIMCIGNNPNTYSIFYTQTHHMYDITRENGFWNAIDLGNVTGQRNTFGVAPNTLSMDMAPQASRTDEGSKVFFSWSGSDIVFVPNSPNLFGAAYDVVTRNWTQTKDFTSCNPATNGKILFPKMAENVLDVTGGWELPVIYGESTSGTDVAVACNFNYLDSLKFTQADFILPQCVANITFSSGDTLNLCQGSSGVIVLSSSQNGLLWNTGSTSPILTVTTGGWYSVAIRSGCCTGRDSVFVNIIPTPVSAFTSSVNDFNVDFSDQSTGVTGTYTYDFGDGNTSSLQNPTHNYAAPGSYTVCLTVTSNGCVDSVCHVVNVTCTMPVINFSYTIGNGGLATFTNSTSPSADNYTWDFGDGSTSNLENPTHVYTASGNYTVCLQISDSCGNDTTCIGISVIANLSTQELFGANFTLSPNPTQNFVLVSAQNLADQIWNLQLVNGIGQEFWGKEISGTTIQETVPMENLASGIYFLRIQSEGRVMDYKLVKE